MSPKKLAIVVQRCHPYVVGGSEEQAWQYAKLLKNDYEVEILTTTAIDASTWDNVFSEGAEIQDGIVIKRFFVDIQRSPYWHKIHRILLNDFSNLNKNPTNLNSLWTLAMQEEFIKKQGPFSKSLNNYLLSLKSHYSGFIFLTYLFPTTYFGIQYTGKYKSILVPTLHDEVPAYLNAYKYMANNVSRLLWNTKSEAIFGEGLWGKLPGSIVSMAINTEYYEPKKISYPYILYCGRIDINKGCDSLFDYFSQFKADYPSELKLLLTGKAEMPIRNRSDIEYLGFVSEEEKLSLMAGAKAFIMPSQYESLSIVTLEAMAQLTPVLVNRKCQALLDHVVDSGGGEGYDGYEEFSYALNELLELSSSRRHEIGLCGREYILKNYDEDIIKERLLNEVKYIVQN